MQGIDPDLVRRSPSLIARRAQLYKHFPMGDLGSLETDLSDSNNIPCLAALFLDSSSI